MKGDRPTGYLTPREHAVLADIARGYCNAEIADHLAVSTSTVGKFREELCRKLEVHSTVALVLKAVELSVVQVRQHPLVPVRNGRRLRYAMPTLK